ncbi:uncharacterized protein LOC141670601 [Apium graveolens]|uniref:uncharacterized protein LOC141670601 n=1 Tax=Apium graveolens TaxID=4045 RepID=UPI003D7BC655
MDAIDTKHQLGIDVEVVKQCYCLEKFSNCRIDFSNMNTDDPLILNNDTVNDRNWKKDYFLLRRSLLAMVLPTCLTVVITQILILSRIKISLRQRLLWRKFEPLPLVKEFGLIALDIPFIMSELLV